VRTEPSDAWLTAPYDREQDDRDAYDYALELFLDTDAYGEALGHFMYDWDENTCEEIPTGKTEEDFLNSDTLRRHVRSFMEPDEHGQRYRY
jgi:hypothetical protein